LQAFNQSLGRYAGGAVNPELVPETCRPQPTLGLVEGVGVVREGLDLLYQSGDIALKAVVGDGGRHLPEMVAVLDPLGDEGGLLRVVMERRGRQVQVRQRRGVEDRLHARVALRDIDDVAMDVVDGAPDKLPEIGSENQRAGR